MPTKQTHYEREAAIAAAIAFGHPAPSPAEPPVVPAEPPTPIQVVRHRGTWHLLVVATMRTGCCDQPVARIREIASEVPADGPRCSKLVAS